MFADGAGGPVKFPVVRTISDRVDVQVLGPTEVFDLDVECGSGLCQRPMTGWWVFPGINPFIAGWHDLSDAFRVTIGSRDNRSADKM